MDAIRDAYDLGYNDARNAKAVPGDSAPGYHGRDVETDHGGALFNTLQRRWLASQPMSRDPLTDAQWLKKWTGFTGLRVKPGEDRDWLLGILRFAERTLGFSHGKV